MGIYKAQVSVKKAARCAVTDKKKNMAWNTVSYNYITT